ncbi:hypothetical protein BVC80_1731g31 [Macleaya cordata]|uniref:AMP-activated protein kinase glycogen-binding domain-containing protein n=1 Tax=Macleaya cordata TaxID=56857 RepID=A0A200Q935_MACCD|nr:hypothetical protein BVC80_1731g31 [Macleaya cordata]
MGFGLRFNQASEPKQTVQNSIPPTGSVMREILPSDPRSHLGSTSGIIRVRVIEKPTEFFYRILLWRVRSPGNRHLRDMVLGRKALFRGCRRPRRLPRNQLQKYCKIKIGPTSRLPEPITIDVAVGRHKYALVLDADSNSVRALMATLCHFPSFSCTYQKLSTSIHSFNVDQQHHQLRLGTQRFPPRRLIIIYAAASSSTKNSSVKKKVRAGRTVKSNSELCNDLREFISMVGLPEGHVPSLKELTQHGRKDLANIVRRRGYKLITELLTVSTERNTITSTENQDLNNGQDEIVDSLAESVLAPSEGSISGNYPFEANGVEPLISDTQSSIESSSSSSLQEKAAKFVLDGELDAIEDQVDEGDRCTELVNKIQAESPFSEESLKYEAAESNATSTMTASATISELVAPLATEYSGDRDDFLSAEGLNGSHDHEHLDAEASERDNQVEIDRLKVMLHHQELELSQLKERIEKEKFALSILQAKAEKEIGKSQEIIVAKDEELQAAEESLSGLKEVQIEFWGNAETVEVAGSFNGWHHQIKMDAVPSSTTINPTGSRKSRLWSTVLWLYPGIYEVWTSN